MNREKIEKILRENISIEGEPSHESIIVDKAVDVLLSKIAEAEKEQRLKVNVLIDDVVDKLKEGKYPQYLTRKDCISVLEGIEIALARRGIGEER